MSRLLVSREVEQMFRWPRGRALRMAKQGKLPHLILPDGSIRFEESAIASAIRASDVKVEVVNAQ